MGLNPMLGASIFEAEYWLGPPRSSYAAQIDFTYMFITWVSFISFILVMTAMVYFCIKYRRVPGKPMEKSPTHNSALEIAWSVIPSIIVVYMFYLGFVGFMDMRTMPENGYEIAVTGQKWFWKFTYGNGKFSMGGQVPEDANWHDNESILGKAPELHVPVGTDVILTMNSMDVLHSFFIPAFRAKQDVVPGRYTKMWFRATETGVYPLFCTEYCGDKHSEMLGRVFVDTQADFDAWYTKYSDPETLYPDPIERGKYFYNSRGCAQCHSLDGSTKVNGGPSFLGNFGKSVEFEGAPSQIVDENYIRESILQPLLKIRKGYGKIMPAGLITKEKEIDALILFIKELNKPTGAK